MIEILPIRVLTDEDAPIFGNLNVILGKLKRSGFEIGDGVAITAPEFKLKAILEHYELNTKEIFQQSLTLVKREINAIPVPEILNIELGKHKQFFLGGEQIKSAKGLWLALLDIWLEIIKKRLWDNGFSPGITENLDPQIVIFVKKVEGYGCAYPDPLQSDVVINTKIGKLHPNDLKKISDLVQLANKKLFIPHEYEWILDRGVKLVGIKPYTQLDVTLSETKGIYSSPSAQNDSIDKKPKSAVRILFDLSTGFTIEKNVDGIYIDSEKIFDLNRPTNSFEDLVFKLVESAMAFPESPVLFKLADKSEGMGQVRGALRLLHQKSLFEPLAEALDFARHKKGLTNIHIVIPFIRGTGELLQIKRELAVKKLNRKNSLEIWMEAAIPENIINMEDYLMAGIDGVVLNMDELIAHLNGFDPKEAELAFYKQETEGLIKFLEDAIRLLHKSKVPFIAYGSLSLYPKVLEFLVEKGVYGIVAEKYDAHSAKDLLYQTEKRVILSRIV